MKTYRGLRFLVRVLQVLGWLVLVIGFLLACFEVTTPFMAKEGPLASPLLVGALAAFGAFIGLSFVVAGTVFSLTLFFAAAVVELLLDIQANTGDTRELLRRALTKPDPASPRQDTPAQVGAVPSGYKRP